MKNLVFLLVVASSFLSCGKDDSPIFTIPVQNLVFSVNPTVQPPFTYYIPINDVSIQAMNIIAARGMDTSEVQSIRPFKANLSVVFADGDLDFLDAVSIRICPLGINEENCGQEVFYRDPVPQKTGGFLNLAPSNAGDVREVVYPAKVNVQVKLERLRDYVDHTFDIRLDMEFGVW